MFIMSVKNSLLKMKKWPIEKRERQTERERDMETEIEIREIEAQTKRQTSKRRLY